MQARSGQFMSSALGDAARTSALLKEGSENTTRFLLDLSNKRLEAEIWRLGAAIGSLKSARDYVAGNRSVPGGIDDVEGYGMSMRQQAGAVLAFLGEGSDEASVNNILNDRAASQELARRIDGLIRDFQWAMDELPRMRRDFLARGNMMPKAEADSLIGGLEQYRNDRAGLTRYLDSLRNGSDADRQMYNRYVLASLRRAKVDSNGNIKDMWSPFQSEASQPIEDSIIKFHFKDDPGFMSKRTSSAGYDERRAGVAAEMKRDAGVALSRIDYVPEGTAFSDSGISAADLGKAALAVDGEIHSIGSRLYKNEGLYSAGLMDAVNSGNQEAIDRVLASVPSANSPSVENDIKQLLALRKRAHGIVALVRTMDDDSQAVFQATYCGMTEGSTMAPYWENEDELRSVMQSLAPKLDRIEGAAGGGNGSMLAQWAGRIGYSDLGSAIDRANQYMQGNGAAQ